MVQSDGSSTAHVTERLVGDTLAAVHRLQASIALGQSVEPQANRVRILRYLCRLQEPNRDALVSYARFIGDTADHVVDQPTSSNQLMETTLAKDRDFVTWRAEHPDAAAESPATERRTRVVLEHDARDTTGFLNSYARVACPREVGRKVEHCGLGARRVRRALTPAQTRISAWRGMALGPGPPGPLQPHLDLGALRYRSI